MSVVDWLRKGLGYVLLTMGVSRPAPKSQPQSSAGPKPGAKPEDSTPRP